MVFLFASEKISREDRRRKILRNKIFRLLSSLLRKRVLHPTSRPAAQWRKQDYAQKQTRNDAAEVILPGNTRIVKVKTDVNQQPEGPLTDHGVASWAKGAAIDKEEGTQRPKDNCNGP